MMNPTTLHTLLAFPRRGGYEIATPHSDREHQRGRSGVTLQGVGHLIGCSAHRFPQVCCEMKTINRENSAAAKSATR